MHDSTSPISVPTPDARRLLDQHLWLALLLAGALIIPRSVAIARAHSESIDDDYHLVRGLAYLTHRIDPESLSLNDPPLGEGLVALPLLLTNLFSRRPAGDPARYADHPLGPDALAMIIAAWKAILFLPLVGVAFHWCRTTYGLRSAWLAVALLIVEPTFAAHVPIAAIDSLGVEGVVIACFLGWRFFERPTIGRMVAAGVGIGAALMLKHTALVLPAVMMALAVLWWGIKPRRDGQDWPTWREDYSDRQLAVLRMTCVVILTLCALTLFDVGNYYFRALFLGIGHMRGGHPGYLLGQERITGWWYYFPVVAWYKVPFGIGVVLLLGLLSVRRTPPRWAEWGLVVPLLIFLSSLFTSKINIGFRHFLPAYAFLLMLASRCVAEGGRVWSAVAWGAVAAAGIHAASFHPDYLSYMNFPRHQPYLAISDSNVDWGQALKQVRDYIDARPRDGQTIYLHHFGSAVGRGEDPVRYYIGDRGVVLKPEDPPPSSGLLIISPVYVAGVYDDRDYYTGLQRHEPDAVIGHTMLVYDLDRLGGGKPFRWPPPKPTASAPRSPPGRSHGP